MVHSHHLFFFTCFTFHALIHALFFVDKQPQCVDYGSALGTTKYSILPMLSGLPKSQKVKLLPVVSKAKSLRELCRTFSIEDYYDTHFVD